MSLINSSITSFRGAPPGLYPNTDDGRSVTNEVVRVTDATQTTTGGGGQTQPDTWTLVQSPASNTWFEINGSNELVLKERGDYFVNMWGTAFPAGADQNKIWSWTLVSANQDTPGVTRTVYGHGGYFTPGQLNDGVASAQMLVRRQDADVKIPISLEAYAAGGTASATATEFRVDISKLN